MGKSDLDVTTSDSIEVDTTDDISFGGSIYFDYNNDCNLSTSESASTHSGTVEVVLYSTDDVELDSLTTSTGNFEFSVSRPGNYKVQVRSDSENGISGCATVQVSSSDSSINVLVFDESLDSDSDGFGDACDVCPGGDDNLDTDGDGTADYCDNCPDTNSSNFVDGDNDGFGDPCDICPTGDDTADADGDSVPDACDKCPGGNDKVDTDGDSVPDACDECEGFDDKVDTDGDGAINGCDICEG